MTVIIQMIAKYKLLYLKIPLV